MKRLLRNALSAPSSSAGPPPDAARQVMTSIGQQKLHAFLRSGRQLALPEAPVPVVSIIVPTYQQAHFTYGLLEALLTTPDAVPFELIIVDNQSTDETRALLQRIDNLRLKLNEENVGFAAACNIGAGLARGEYVCFLNSDTIPTPGWLDALVSAARSRPACGAVGARLVYPDGRLQEAGAVAWRDGKTTAYGRQGVAEQPEYGYLREVDYCSAACLLVRRDAFLRVGGFDEKYALMYYEDVDLAFALRAAGFTMLYQPEAIVIHVEFGSSDAGRAIDLQQRNRARFVEKWGGALALQPRRDATPLVVARDRRPSRRILVADDCIPFPGFGAGFPRANALVRALAQLGYVVTFAPLRDTAPHQPTTAELQRLGVETLTGGGGAGDLERLLQDRANVFDAAIISRIDNVHLLRRVRALSPRTARIYDAEAIFALRHAGQREIAGSPLSAEERDTAIRAEISPMVDADLVITVSERERALILQQRPETQVVVWGHAVEPRVGPPGLDGRAGLLFVGALGSAPNADALRFFLAKVWPKIAARVDGDFSIVGAGAGPELIEAVVQAGERVRLLGYVEDLDALYDRARVFVAPHRFGSGLPLKVVEAMAAGVPCVVSRLLAEQLGLQEGGAALVADDAEALAAQVICLCEDDALWRQTQQSALDLVGGRFSADRLREQLGELLESTITRTQD